MLRVTCAIIRKDGLVLIAQRGREQSNPLKWEFPGGKVEEGEEEAACVVREVHEELGFRIRTVGRLRNTVCTCPGRPIELIPFVCEVVEGEPQPVEHNAVLWVRPEALGQYEWCAADLGIIAQLKEQAG